MKNGLMTKDKVENLGYTKINSYDNEMAKKKELYQKLVRIDKLAERNILTMRGEDAYDNNLYQV